MAPLIIRTKATIYAPVSQVWHTLLHVDAYSQWNPFIIDVTRNGTATEVGTILTFRVLWPSGAEGHSIEEVTQVIAPAQQLNGVQQGVWTYAYRGLPYRLGMLRVSRVQTVTALTPTTTEYESTLVFRGLGRFLIPKSDIEQGCAAQAKALATQFSSSPSVDTT